MNHFALCQNHPEHCIGKNEQNSFLKKEAHIFTIWLHLFHKGKVGKTVVDVCLSDQSFSVT